MTLPLCGSGLIALARGVAKVRMSMAWTGRVLPCFVIHLVFNGVQVIGLLFEHFRQAAEPEQRAAARALYELLPQAPGLFL